MGQMKFAYQRGGAPLLSWKHGPPRQSRAADSVALGSTLDAPTLADPSFRMPLPRPGAPEPLGCGCASAGADITIDVASPSFLAGLAAGYLLLRILRSA